MVGYCSGQPAAKVAEQVYVPCAALTKTCTTPPDSSVRALHCGAVTHAWPMGQGSNLSCSLGKTAMHTAVAPPQTWSTTDH
jgi:hypothetical protein